MLKVCPFGKIVKKKLVDIDKGQDWLINAVRADTGLYFDHGYLQKIFRGDLATPSIIRSICKVLDIAYPTESEEKEETHEITDRI